MTRDLIIRYNFDEKKYYIYLENRADMKSEETEDWCEAIKMFRNEQRKIERENRKYGKEI